MKFAEPWMLLGVPISLVVLPLAWWLLDRARRRALLAFAHAPTLARIAPLRPVVSGRIRRVLVLLAAMFLSLAAARPQWGTSSEVVRRKGLDVVFLLDTSLSMAAPAAGEPGPRLDAARRAMTDLLKMLRGDRAALVVFAGEAQLLCPLTVDEGALRLLLDSADPNLLPTTGTDIGAGLGKALTAFRNKERKFKAIIVLSDGEDNESAGIATAGRAREQGVVIHAIGFGSLTGEPIPLRDSSGRIEGYKKDSAGHVVSSRLDETTLRAVAEAGGGIYVPAAAGESGLKKIADSIAAMERREYESNLATQAEERFEWPLLVAFSCLVLEALMGILARGERAAVLMRTAVVTDTVAATEPKATAGGRGRKRHRALAVLLVLLAHTASALAVNPAEQGRRAFEAKQFAEAADWFRKALEKDPDSAVLHYNLGTALLEAGKGEEALSELARAAAVGDAATRARAHYNAGNAYYAAGKRKEALEEYRQALRQAPPDVDAKHNYELVQRELQQSPTPSPTPSPSPSPNPSPSPSPDPNQSPTPAPSPTPSPGASPTPGEGEPTPSPDPQGSPTPSKGEGLDKEQAERLLDALEAQEAQDRKDKQKKKAEVRQRRPEKDW